MKCITNALTKVVAEGGNILVEGGVLSGEGYESGCYVKPAIAEAQNSFEIVQHETFAPVLYLMKYSTVEKPSMFKMEWLKDFLLRL